MLGSGNKTSTCVYTPQHACQYNQPHPGMEFISHRSLSESGENLPWLYRTIFSQEKYDQPGTSKLFVFPLRIISLIKVNMVSTI